MNKSFLLKAIIIGEILVNATMRHTNYFIWKLTGLNYYEPILEKANKYVYYPMDTYCLFLCAIALLCINYRNKYVLVLGWGLLVLTGASIVDDIWFNYKRFETNDAIAEVVAIVVCSIAYIHYKRSTSVKGTTDAWHWLTMAMLATLFVIIPVSRGTTFEAFIYGDPTAHFFFAFSALLSHKFYVSTDTHFRSLVVISVFAALALHNLLDEFLFYATLIHPSEHIIVIMIVVIGIGTFFQSKYREMKLL